MTQIWPKTNAELDFQQKCLSPNQLTWKNYFKISEHHTSMLVYCQQQTIIHFSLFYLSILQGIDFVFIWTSRRFGRAIQIFSQWHFTMDSFTWLYNDVWATKRIASAMDEKRFRCFCFFRVSHCAVLVTRVYCIMCRCQNGFFSALPFLGLWAATTVFPLMADKLRSAGLMQTVTVRRVFNTVGKRHFYCCW